MIEVVTDFRRGDLRVAQAIADAPIYPPLGWEIQHEERLEAPNGPKYIGVYWRRARTRYEPPPGFRTIGNVPLVSEVRAFRGVGVPAIVEPGEIDPTTCLVVKSEACAA